MFDNSTLNQHNNDFEIDYKGSLICYNGNDEEIFLPNTVVEIGEGAFFGNNKIVKVVLPYSVTKIGENAFKDCCNLQVVEMSPNVTEIGVAAFMDCTFLKEIIIPDGVNEVLDKTFLRCRNLSNVKLSKNIKRIGENAFEGCHSLKTILLPDGLIEIKYQAFAHSGLEDVTIPGTVDKLWNEEFRCSELKNVRVLEGCTSIEWSSMASNYNGIKKYYLPSTLGPAGMFLHYDKLYGQSIIYSPFNAKIIAFCQVVSGVKWEIDFDNPKTIKDIVDSIKEKKGVTKEYMQKLEQDKKTVLNLEAYIDTLAIEIQKNQQEVRNLTGIFSNVKRNKLNKERVAKFHKMEDTNRQIKSLKNRINQCEQEVANAEADLKNISGQELKDIIDEKILSLKKDIEYYIEEYIKRPEPLVSCNYTLSMDSVNKVRNSMDYILVPAIDVSDM